MSADPKDARIRALDDEVGRLSRMLESAPDFITRITVDGDFLYLNRLAPGFDMNDVLGTSVDNYVPPEFRQRARQAMQAARDTGKVQEYATIGRTSAQTVGHYLTRVSPVVENGVVTSLVMIATDVTALQESRTLLQVALKATELGIWTYEPARGSGSWDETTRRIFGIPIEIAAPKLGQMLDERVHPDDRARVREGIEQAMQDGRYGPIEHRIALPGGQVRWVTASGITERDHDGVVTRIVGSVMDITERRALEQRLQEAQKLESIGRLAGGVAHDFNNMLTAILGNVDLAAGQARLEDALPLLTEIRLTAERSAALTTQLLAFARRQVIEPKLIEPNRLITRLAPVLKRVGGEGVKVELALHSTGCVRVDESQLEQVVLNLLTNARQSMPEGGRATIKTRDVTLDGDDAARFGLASGAYLSLAVSDIGTGIPPEALAHVFEPFFTTRQGGTGLGLATCYGIVKQSGGHIAVHSTPGRGATFLVYLPRVEGEALVVAPLVPPVASPTAGERVLLVEDEPAVRNIIERTLAHGNYKVSVATNGEEALQLVAAGARFDLLITDVAMPGISGWQLGTQLAERFPELPILYMSGYAELENGDGVTLGQDVHFLQKPFLPDQLLLAVRRLLDS